MTKRKTVRIKKGVSPYGGRRMLIMDRLTLPNGRQVVGLWLRGQHVLGPVRWYNADEVEDERDE
jgi:hypothetical protein